MDKTSAFIGQAAMIVGFLVFWGMFIGVCVQIALTLP